MDLETKKVFEQIAQGNYSPDLAPFNQQRDRLKAVVRDRMKVTL